MHCSIPCRVGGVAVAVTATVRYSRHVASIIWDIIIGITNRPNCRRPETHQPQYQDVHTLFRFSSPLTCPLLHCCMPFAMGNDCDHHHTIFLPLSSISRYVDPPICCSRASQPLSPPINRFPTYNYIYQVTRQEISSYISRHNQSLFYTVFLYVCKKYCHYY